MRRVTMALVGLAVAAGCDLVEPPSAARCVAVAGEATPSATQVCARLNALDCRLPACEEAYATYEARVSTEEFNRLTSCYVHAASCSEVDQCERACGSDGGAVLLGPMRDASGDAVTDATTDAAADAGDDVGGDVGEDAGADVGSD